MTTLLADIKKTRCSPSPRKHASHQHQENTLLTYTQKSPCSPTPRNNKIHQHKNSAEEKTHKHHHVPCSRKRTWKVILQCNEVAGLFRAVTIGSQHRAVTEQLCVGWVCGGTEQSNSVLDQRVAARDRATLCCLSVWRYGTEQLCVGWVCFGTEQSNSVLFECVAVRDRVTLCWMSVWRHGTEQLCVGWACGGTEQSNSVLDERVSARERATLGWINELTYN